MNAKDLKTDEVYALGRGDVRRDFKDFRRVVFLRRVTPKYDEFNRTKQVNRGLIVVRVIDDPWQDPDETAHFRTHRHPNQWAKGTEIEIDPRTQISWTWAEFEAAVGTALREEAEWQAKEKAVTEYFLELGVSGDHLHLGRRSLYHRDRDINMMLSGDSLDDCGVDIPFGILRKLVAGTEIKEEDWNKGGE